MPHSKHFRLRFNKLSCENEEDIALFTEALTSCNGQVRKTICDLYGFSLIFDGDDIKVAHDGQKVGSGRFSANNTYYTFDIFPKSEGVNISELLQIYFQNFNKPYGTLHEINQQKVGFTESEYSFAHLIGLLKEISNLSAGFVNIYSKKKLIKSKGSVRGRIISNSFVCNQLLGNLDLVESEILDNQEMKEYATVFYYTALSILERINSSSIDKAFKNFDSNALFNKVKSILKPYVTNRISAQTLIRLSKPPFPFGVRELFFKCYHYWMSSGALSTGSNGKDMAFSGFTIQLDKLFEDYVGLILQMALSTEYRALPKQNYYYKVSDNHNDRALEPDHMVVETSSSKMHIVEVKYSNDIAPREHVAQVISYLDYNYKTYNDFNKTGLIVYPGETESFSVLNAFSHKVGVVTITSNLEKSKNFIADAIKNI